jgi:hypothetical protein
MGKSTISMAIFYVAFCMFTRPGSFFPPVISVPLLNALRQLGTPKKPARFFGIDSNPEV